VLGYLWTVLEPLLMSLVFWFIFTKLFIRGDPRFTDPYIVFLLSGQLPWYWFNAAVSGTTKSLLGEAQMVRSTNVPRELWVLRTILAKGAEFIFSLPVLIAFILFYRPHINIEILYWPVAFLLEWLLLVGLGLMLASVTVLVRDVDRIVRIILRVLFYGSPVLYSINQGRIEKVAWLYTVNPIAGILDLFRVGIFPLEMDRNRVIVASIETVLIFVLGIFVFARLERQILKEI
jgi:ABC-2 type transport system permease protein